MASEMHGQYTVVSRPAWLPDDAAWVPFSVVMWKDKQDFHWREFTTNKRFTMEKEAVLFGLTSARAWIGDHPLPAQDISRFVSEENIGLHRRRASDSRRINLPS
jgi:hypothetical protein